MIGIFDSGYGGLTVFKPILTELPQYDYIYLGDSARSPYGIHSDDNIKRFAEQAVEYLFDRGVTLIIFACNTASAVALRHVQQKYLNGAQEKDRKILGVLIPAAEEVAESTKTKRVGIVGTKATINSKSYEKEIQKLDSEIKIHSQACPLLVPLIEEDWHKKPEAITILKKYLNPLKSCNIDTLVLGCTHYPLMKGDFKRIMGKRTQILDSGEITAKKLKQYLEKHPEIEKKLSKGRTRTFLTTDDPVKFKDFTEKHFGMKIKGVEKVGL
jgi:glutamate racemase